MNDNWLLKSITDLALFHASILQNKIYKDI